jgi:hypothetical protein
VRHRIEKYGAFLAALSDRLGDLRLERRFLIPWLRWLEKHFHRESTNSCILQRDLKLCLWPTVAHALCERFDKNIVPMDDLMDER